MKALSPALKSLMRHNNASDYFGKVTFNISKLTSFERITSPVPRPLNRATQKPKRIAAMLL